MAWTRTGRTRSVVAMLSAVLLAVAYDHVGGTANADRPTQAERPHAQNHGARTTTDGTLGAGGPDAQTRLPIALEGSKEPDRIPDRLAYFHLIRVLSQRTNPTKQEIARRDALLKPIGLAPTDRAALSAALSGLKEGLDRVAAARRSLKSEALVGVSAQVTAAALKREEDTLLDQALSRLTASLSPDGIDRLQRYVRNHVKQRIVVYGDARGLDFAFN